MDRTEAFSTMRDVIAEQLEVEPASISENSNLVDDLDADSLDLLQLVTTFEDTFDVAIPDEDFERIKTVSDALDVLMRLKG
jgi:acyl carrier protein